MSVFYGELKTQQNIIVCFFFYTHTPVRADGIIPVTDYYCPAVQLGYWCRSGIKGWTMLKLPYIKRSSVWKHQLVCVFSKNWDVQSDTSFHRLKISARKPAVKIGWSWLLGLQMVFFLNHKMEMKFSGKTHSKKPDRFSICLREHLAWL